MNRLRELRKQYNMTQSDIAKKINISQQAYAKYELEHSNPDINTLILLSKIYKCSIDYLINPENDSQPPLTPFQLELIELTKDLNKNEQDKIIAYIQGIKDLKK